MSLYRGIVTDTNDPEGLVRVKARVPQVYGGAESDWMWPSMPIAMGVQAPAVGDPVWVMFEGDDKARPVWVGVWRTSPLGGLDPDLHFGGVVAETTYGLASSNGAAQTVSRSDHTHGSPALTSSTPTTIDPDDGPTVGVGTTPARHDHQHAIVAAVAGAIAFGDSAAEGVATSFSRSDHRHQMPADPVIAHEANPNPHPNYSTDADLADSTVLFWMTRVTS